MKLLILTHAGGSYNALRPEAEIYMAIAQAGHEVTMMLDTRKEYADKFQAAGIRLIHHETGKKLDLAAIRRIRKTIDESDCDLVYATYSRNISNAAFACIGKPVKMVAYRGTTGGLYWYDPSSYLGILHPRIDAIVCVSHAVENFVKSRVSPRLLPHVKTIYKGHDLAWYTAPALNLETLGSDASNFNVICVADARIHKGLRYLLEAMAHLADISDLHLIMVGRNIDQEPYKSLIAQSGMSERIHLTGYRDDAPQIIAGCNLLVLPSLREGLPRVLLESLAYQVPVITSDNPGSMEIIDDGINGYVVPRKNGTAIAQRIRELYFDRATLNKLATHAHDKLKAELSHRQSVESMIQFFESTIA